jgi:hypothetical protein
MNINDFSFVIKEIQIQKTRIYTKMVKLRELIKPSVDKDKQPWKLKALLIGVFEFK